MTFHDLESVLRALLAVLFVGAGLSHFLPTVKRMMAAMIPPPLRRVGPASPENLVVFSGICEIAGGIGLLVPGTAVWAGIALIILLAAVFPANAYAAGKRKRFGWVAVPFWPRLIAQLVLMGLIVLVII